MFTDLLSTTGSGARIGTHGIVLGIGDIIPAGGTYTVVGRTTGTGITAMHSTITIITAHSITDIIRATVIMRCMDGYRAENMQWRTQTVRSAAGMQA